MKKLSLKNATSMLSRNEMKAIFGGGYEETCFYEPQCTYGCVRILPDGVGGYKAYCSQCCIA